MSQGHKTSYSGGPVIRLRNELYRFYDILDIEGTWTVEDLEGKRTTHDELRLLHQSGAIESVDRVRYKPENEEEEEDYEGNNGIVNVWKWNEEIRAELKEYWDEVDTFPDCGHRVNIFNSREVPEGKLTCKYCAEQGEYPEFDKEFVKSLL